MCDNVRHVSRILTWYARDNENNEVLLHDDKMCNAMQTARLHYGEIIFHQIKNNSSAQFYGAEFIDQSERCVPFVNKSIESNPIFPRIANARSFFYDKYFLIENNQI